MHRMLESGLLREYSKLAGHSVYCMVTFVCRVLPIGQVCVLRTVKDRKGKVAGGVEGI